MRFSTIISNPPYNGTVDLKILDSILQLSDNVCFVHPLTYLIEKKGTNKALRDKLSDRLVSVDVFNGNVVFGIAIYVECGIVYISESNNGTIVYNTEAYDDIHQISKFGNSPLYYSIENKIKKLSASSNVWESRIVGSSNEITGKFYVCIAGGRAHVEQTNPNEAVFRKNDYYTICSLDLAPTDHRKTHHNWEFNTEQECYNFIEYLNTKFARFCVAIVKNNMHIDSGELRLVPAFDFTKRWTNEACAREAGITDDELFFMLSNIQNYYKTD